MRLNRSMLTQGAYSYFFAQEIGARKYNHCTLLYMAKVLASKRKTDTPYPADGNRNKEKAP